MTPVEPPNLVVAKQTMTVVRVAATGLLSALMAIAALTVSATPAVADEKPAAIRPFRANVPDSELADMKRRLAATRWPDRETVTDLSQGPQLAKVQELVRHWGTRYDWRRAEAKLNAHPQYVTEIDGVDIHFIHVRSRHPNALPLIVAHGWPGSVSSRSSSSAR